MKTEPSDDRGRSLDIMFRSLTKPLLTFGVPSVLFTGEVVVIALAVLASWWIALVPVILLHGMSAGLYAYDPLIIQILGDILILPQETDL